MDISNNNRYELLFLDEDASAQIKLIEKVTAKKKVKQPQPASASTLPKQISAASGKENKLNPVNKTVVKGKDVKKDAPAAQNQVRSKSNSVQGQGLAKGTRRDGEQNNSNIQHGQGTRDRDQQQRNPKRNGQSSGGNFVGASVGEYANNDRSPRQFRDRDNQSRGAGRLRNGERFGKREFDRQSGSDKTGVKSIDKRDGAGAHNWGSAKQDIEDISKSVEGDGGEASTDKEDSANEQQIVEQTNTQGLEEEEESKEMTLDEWKALTGQRVKPQYNLRKAGEGVDNAEWKKMVVLNKKKETNDSEEELEYDPSLYPQRVGRVQRVVDIEFNFNDNRHGGFRNRNRNRFARTGVAAGGGGNAGNNERNDNEKGRGQGQGQGQRNFGNNKPRFGGNTSKENRSLKVDDERQFPTLG